MRYVLINKRSKAETEITREEARDRISRYYVERVCTYDEMLSEPGTIPLMFSDLRIEQ